MDAGIGFGLYGHLLRQYLDVWEGRVLPGEWRVRIDGIEIDDERVQPHARHLYNSILVGDIRQLLPKRASALSYDVILFGDVLEHLPKGDAADLLRQAVALAEKRVVIRIPLGWGWRREGRKEPDHHRSTWERDDFSAFACSIRQYDYYGNGYALVSIDAPLDRARKLAHTEHRLLELEQHVQRLVTSQPAVR
jgi:hypothetical protein